MLLCSLLSSYNTFRVIIQYSRDTLKIDEVYDALFSKEKMKELISSLEKERLFWLKEDCKNEIMVGENNGGSKSRNHNVSCNYCKKPGHIFLDAGS